MGSLVTRGNALRRDLTKAVVVERESGLETIPGPLHMYSSISPISLYDLIRASHGPLPLRISITYYVRTLDINLMMVWYQGTYLSAIWEAVGCVLCLHHCCCCLKVRLKLVIQNTGTCTTIFVSRIKQKQQSCWVSSTHSYTNRVTNALGSDISLWNFATWLE